MNLQHRLGRAAVSLFFSLPGVLFAQSIPADIDWLTQVRGTDTFSAAGLTRADQEQILKQVETSSFHIPDSWLGELRVGRISLSKYAGLVVRGTQLLCGATGNCQTWVFQRENGKWRSMFDGEAPVVSGVGLVRQNAAVRDLVTTAHLSAEREHWSRYRFDGHVYRRTEYYQADGGATGRRTERVARP